MPVGKIIGFWAIIAGLLFWNGLLAIGVFKPLLGNEAGEMMSAFIGMAIIFGAGRPFLLAEPPRSRAVISGIGAIWLLLTVLFELGLGRAAQAILPGRAPLYGMWDGSFWPLIVLSMAIAPFLWLQRHPLPLGRVTK